MAESYYQVREFAERAGVTVRTLHHYDHLGLLKPTVTTESGYRLYSDRDFARLQQIVTLKFIGLSLRQIKELFDGELYDLATMLRLQRSVMMEKQRRLEQAIQAIDRAERVVAAGDEPTWNLFTRIIEVIEMEPNMDMFKKYFSPEQLSDMEKRYHAEHDSIKQTESRRWPGERSREASTRRGWPDGGRNWLVASQWAISRCRRD
jgi:DNA-binding transcriptional MerR regulator